ncbi:CocE/NonD family hydrolase [Enterovirga sp.]|uniref:CocE/NonD family hydrolase n=1 Tax=Enterovirga sp. TaxID=2026350 RepID=UPI00262FB4FA|nr:CocE/NonD family hydrolase [Enterovirga sp.]MDB5592215.1 peptidase [Enterovirga sp.]
MTEHEGEDAWLVTPGAYLASRPAEFAIPAPRSRYLVMRDGCRLAVDVYLPAQRDEGGPKPAERLPAILILTPYYRRFRMRDGAEGEPSPNAGKYRDAFVPRGYALVVVDTRGTGASFGTRDSFRSPREREDSREVADWIVSQPWSDGRIGATGVSYLGAGADFLAATGHPAVKAIAPLFSVWDTYADNYYPGGILLTGLTRVYDELMVALDHDRRDLLKSFSYFANPDFEGPQPVDDDPEGVLVREAVAEHRGNFRQTDFMAEFRFRDDALPYDPDFTSASFSPYSVAAGIRPEVAVYSVSGWRDGAGYANGAIARHLTLANNPRHLLLGPWDHGARIDVSPWRQAVEPRFPLLGEILRFFDHYLLGRPTGLNREAPIHLFALHAERWRAAQTWPPAEGGRRLSLAAGGQLRDDEARSAPAPDGPSEQIQVDFSWGSGTGTRYERIAGIDSRDYYPDWADRAARLASWTSEPLPESLELTGHALVDLTLAASEPDAALFCYLSEVEADGQVRYVTEGLLRALHRAEAPCPDSYRTAWPFRTFARGDAQPLVPGRRERIRIPCLPVAWRFAAGSRIRLSISGADADHCGQVPHGRPPRLTLDLGRCHVDLPVRPA